MKVSAVSQTGCCPRRNSFISYANSFMSNPDDEKILEKENVNVKKFSKKGLETIEEVTIFQKEVKDGKTTIIA